MSYRKHIWRLTDNEWNLLGPLLVDPKGVQARRGRPRNASDHKIAEVCLFRHFQANAEAYRSFGWNQLPDAFQVPGSTANHRFHEWVQSGTWVQFWDAFVRLRFGPLRKPKRDRRPKSTSPVAAILAEIERSYHFFNDRFFGGTLPTEVALTLDSSAPDAGGYFCGRRWRRKKRQLGHLAISPYLLGDGPNEAMAVLLHEIVHLRNHQVGLPDCDPDTQYHNSHFCDVARLVGLECPVRSPKRGFAATRLTERAIYAIAQLNLDEELFRWSIR